MHFDRFLKMLITSNLRYMFISQDEEGDKSLNMAMENPHKFVLKPQREGGGWLFNNIQLFMILK